MTVVLAAHGSPDPRHRSAIEEIRDAVALRLDRERLASTPAFEVCVGWLGHHAPALTDVVAQAYATGGRPVVVPLLLAPAFHARVDLPQGAGDAQVAPVLAPDARLLDALEDRLAEAQADAAVVTHSGAGAGAAAARAPVVLAAAGSSDPSADRLVRDVAAALSARRGTAVTVGYAAAEPTVSEAVRAAAAAAGLTSAGPTAAEPTASPLRGPVVASFLLAPGRLHDDVVAQARTADPTVVVAAPIGAHPALVDLVVARVAALVAW